MKYLDGREYPLGIALMVTRDTYDGNSNDPYTISATTLMRSPRYIIAKAREKLLGNSLNSEDRISKWIPASIGTAIHTAVEEAIKYASKQDYLNLGYEEYEVDNLDIINEQRYTRCIDGFTINNEPVTFTITGKVDLIINGELHDIKSTSTWSYTSLYMEDKYIKQGSIYHWLTEDIEEPTITIDFIFKDWNKAEYNKSKDKGYPDNIVKSKTYKVWDRLKTNKWIMEKLVTLCNYWDKPLHEIPCCSEHDKYLGSEITYKYYKDPNKLTRATKNFSSRSEAETYKATVGNGLGIIIEHKSKPFECEYCNYEPTEF